MIGIWFIDTFGRHTEHIDSCVLGCASSRWGSDLSFLLLLLPHSLHRVLFKVPKINIVGVVYSIVRYIPVHHSIGI